MRRPRIADFEQYGRGQRARTTWVHNCNFSEMLGVVKEDMMKVFQKFYETSMFEKSLNATFIPLIPKNPRVMVIRDFIHISLLRSV